MNLLTGDVVWADLGEARGRVQAGRRPAVVVASNAYLAIAATLAMVVPVSTRDRGWPNHVPLTGPTGLGSPSFALTEQIRVIDRGSIVRAAGSIDENCLRQIRLYLQDFLEL
jgi:mRNA interferase MazF